jgi:hypothetical protein
LTCSWLQCRRLPAVSRPLFAPSVANSLVDLSCFFGRDGGIGGWQPSPPLAWPVANSLADSFSRGAASTT